MVIAFTHPSLSILDISANEISDWNTIKPISDLKQLNQLYLNENCLTEHELVYDFPFVRSLDMNQMAIADMEQLQRILLHFPSLEELEVRKNPFYEDSVVSREVFVI